MYSLKEQAIREYIAKINFNGNWSYTKIEEDMRRFLGERPFMEVKYKKDVMMNEFSGEAKEVKKLDEVSIWFIDLDNSERKITFIID